MFADAETRGELDEVISLLAVTREDKKKTRVFLDGEGCGMHEVGEAFLYREATNGGYDGVAVLLFGFEIIVEVLVQLVGVFGKRFVEGIVSNFDFRAVNVVFVGDDILRGVGYGDDAVGEVETVLLDLMDKGVALMATGAVVFGSMDVSDEGDMIVLLCDNAGLVGEPVVSVNYFWSMSGQVFLDVVAIDVLDVSDGEVGVVTIRSRDDFAVYIVRIDVGAVLGEGL